jgi:hypothetical protein
MGIRQKADGRRKRRLKLKRGLLSRIYSAFQVSEVLQIPDFSKKSGILLGYTCTSST